MVGRNAIAMNNFKLWLGTMPYFYALVRNAIYMNNFKLWLGTMPYLYALHWHVSIYCNDQ